MFNSIYRRITIGCFLSVGDSLKPPVFLHRRKLRRRNSWGGVQGKSAFSRLLWRWSNMWRLRNCNCSKILAGYRLGTALVESAISMSACRPKLVDNDPWGWSDFSYDLLICDLSETLLLIIAATSSLVYEQCPAGFIWGVPDETFSPAGR
jgi:hypothetical protein